MCVGVDKLSYCIFFSTEASFTHSQPPRSFGGGSKVLELDWSGQESPAQTAEVCPAASLPSKQLFDCLQLLVLN